MATSRPGPGFTAERILRLPAPWEEGRLGLRILLSLSGQKRGGGVVQCDPIPTLEQSNPGL